MQSKTTPRSKKMKSMAKSITGKKNLNPKKKSWKAITFKKKITLLFLKKISKKIMRRSMKMKIIMRDSNKKINKKMDCRT